jgi:hypothetical protein
MAKRSIYERYKMLDSLTENYNLHGMSRDDVIALLGRMACRINLLKQIWLISLGKSMMMTRIHRTKVFVITFVDQQVVTYKTTVINE